MLFRSLDPAALRIDRDRFIAELTARGIGVSVHFIPLGHHPLYRRLLGATPEKFPVAERIYNASISLPLYPSMTGAQVDRVIEAVLAVARERRR